MSFEEPVDPCCIIGQNAAIAFLEMPYDKGDINIRLDSLKLQHIGTVVKRACSRGKHLLHHVPFAAGENEIAVAELLDMSAQKSLDILLRILRNLLELIDGNNTGPVRIGQIPENLLQRVFGMFDVAQLDTEGRHSAYGIEPEPSTDRLEGADEEVDHLFALWQQGLVYLAAEQVSKFAQARCVEDVDKKSIVVPADFFLVIAELDQSRFPHSTWRDNHRVIAVCNGLDEACRLGFSVAEIFRFDFSRHDKRVYLPVTHGNRFSCKCIYLIRIMRIE